MNTAKLFQYVIILHPTKNEEERGYQAKIIVDLKTILAENAENANVSAVLAIPDEYKPKINQIQIALRPF